jgi:hypothetical protein
VPVRDWYNARRAAKVGGLVPALPTRWSDGFVIRFACIEADGLAFTKIEIG